jgi:hypothetical protein
MSRDPAFGRWIAIQLVRLSGVALVVVGAMGMVGTIDMPPLAAFAVASAGLIDAVIFPILLARKWKSPEQ